GTGTATAFTAGSIVFTGAGGVYAQDNANLFWDNINKRAGFGTNLPSYRVHVVTATGTGTIANDVTNTTGTATIITQNTSDATYLKLNAHASAEAGTSLFGLSKAGLMEI